MKSIRNYYLHIIIFLIPFILSSFFRYDYVDFHSNSSIAPGQMLAAESIAREGNISVTEFWGSAGADTFKYKDNWYVPYAPLNSLVSSGPLFVSNGIIKIFELRDEKNINFINWFNSYSAGLVQSVALGGISLLLFLIFKNNYQVRNKVFLFSVPIFFTTSTFLLNYAVSFSNHILVAFFCLWSWYLFSNKKYILASVMVGISLFGEYPSAFLLGFYLLWLLVTRSSLKDIFKILFPTSCFVFLLFLFNTVVFDHPLHFGQLMYEEYNTSIADKAEFAFDPLKGVYLGTVSPLKGVFWYVPILLISIAFLVGYGKKYKYELIVIGGYSLFTLLFYSLWNNCWGDSPLGPRHLISIIPLLAIPLGYPFANGNNPKLSKLYLGVLITWGILFFLLTMANVIDGLPRKEFVACKADEFIYYEKALSVFRSENHKCAPIIIGFLCEN